MPLHLFLVHGVEPMKNKFTISFSLFKIKYYIYQVPR